MSSGSSSPDQPRAKSAGEDSHSYMVSKTEVSSYLRTTNGLEEALLSACSLNGVNKYMCSTVESFTCSTVESECMEYRSVNTSSLNC